MKKSRAIGTEEVAESRAVAGEFIPSTPTKINLANPEDIRREMSRVYREARAKTLDPGDAARFIYMLSQIAKAYELGIIEHRLQLLEDHQRG